MTIKNKNNMEKTAEYHQMITDIGNLVLGQTDEGVEFCIKDEVELNLEIKRIIDVYHASQFKQPDGDVWVNEKPLADREFTLITATFILGYWEYKVWIVRKVHSEEGWYYGICEGDGEEWGDYEDLSAQLYKVIEPLPTPPSE